MPNHNPDYIAVMRCRHEVVLSIMASGLMLVAIGAFVLGEQVLKPFGILGWLFSLLAFWYGIPLSLILALCAAIIYFSDRKAARRNKSD